MGRWVSRMADRIECILEIDLQQPSREPVQRIGQRLHAHRQDLARAPLREHRLQGARVEAEICACVLEISHHDQRAPRIPEFHLHFLPPA